VSHRQAADTAVWRVQVATDFTVPLKAEEHSPTFGAIVPRNPPLPLVETHLLVVAGRVGPLAVFHIQITRRISSLRDFDVPTGRWTRYADTDLCSHLGSIRQMHRTSG
jgi:hypothetical protein